ncbi:hypothetical protein [Tolypothrix sp. VBCCA 56010]|uniref:hypothetical protein n=1 Tax=Tolypothrix sp. VBCCA 56010 TaxID=3137731 RepID=UPI003D7EF0DC
MQVHIGFGFAVELFVIIFSFYCWLFYTPASSSLLAVSTTPETSPPIGNIHKPQKEKREKAEEKDVQDVPHAGQIQYDLTETVEHLTLNEARKVASKLKELKVINDDTNLRGKGINKAFLIQLIQSCVPSERDTVAFSLSQVLGRTIA